MQQQNQYLTISEAAQILRQAPTTVQCDITRNPSKLPPFLRIGARVLFPADQLHAFMLKNIVNANDTKLSDHAHLNSVNKKRRGRPRKALTSSAPESSVQYA